MCTHTHTPLAWSPFDSPTCLPTPYGKSTSLRLSKRLCSFLVHLIYGEYHPKIKFGHIETYVNNLISLLWSKDRFTLKMLFPKLFITDHFCPLSPWSHHSFLGISHFLPSSITSPIGSFSTWSVPTVYSHPCYQFLFSIKMPPIPLLLQFHHQLSKTFLISLCLSYYFSLKSSLKLSFTMP